MNVIEREIFKRTHVDFKKLKKYGFKESDAFFTYRTSFMDDSFEVIVNVDSEGNLISKVIDNDLKEEYTNIYNRALDGSYVAQVKENYIEILNDIKENCFVKDEFIYSQSKRINDYLFKTYKLKPYYPLKKHLHYAYYSQSNDRKPMAMIMNGRDDEYEAIEIKADSETIAQLKEQEGFKESEHLDSDSYISIVMDDKLPDEIIFSLLDRAYELSEKSNSWLVPANPKYYDVIGAFNRSEVIDWKQSAAVKEGDYIYLYLGQPYSCVMYKCLVLETDIPYEYSDENLRINRLMKIQLLKKYQRGEISFAYLNSLGIRAIRSQRRISKAVSDKLK